MTRTVDDDVPQWRSPKAVGQPLPPFCIAVDIRTGGGPHGNAKTWRRKSVHSHGTAWQSTRDQTARRAIQVRQVHSTANQVNHGANSSHTTT